MTTDPTAREAPLSIGDRTVLVRDAGDPEGYPVLYFHGTPGSRRDLRFGEEIAAEQQVRMVSFDRPGYGGSTAGPFGLRSVAHDAAVVADRLGLGSFATLGQSGGGPFALATAAEGDGRVERVGVASGAGPFEEVPGAIGALDDNDSAAYRHLPDDRGRAAAGFGAGFEELRTLLLEQDDAAVVGAFADKLNARDRVLLADARIGRLFIESMREGLRPGVDGGGWDNVAWIGAWDVDLRSIRCPVLLWYGEEDLFAPMAHGEWLEAHLGDARLVRRPSEGHFGIADHFGEILGALAPSP